MQRSQGIAAQTAVVILAAGRGVRMGQTNIGKVCFEIDGVPAVNRTIQTFKEEGFGRFVLVVGDRAEQVMQTVTAEHPDVTFVYQEAQRGTGHAARVAADALEALGYTGYILVTMGDKFLERAAVRALLEGFAKQQADMALLMVPKRKSVGSAGRVVTDGDGRAVDIIEKPDFARQCIVDELRVLASKQRRIKARAIAGAIEKHIPNPAKRATAVGELQALAADGASVERSRLLDVIDSDRYNITVGGCRLSSGEIEKRCKGLNPSLYLLKSEAFYRGIRMLGTRNAQQEYYLTDIVKSLAGSVGRDGSASYSVRTVMAEDPAWIQGFNSPDELLAVQDYVRRKGHGRESVFVSRPALGRRGYAPVREWLSRIEQVKPSMRRWLKRIYGDDEALLRRKCREFAEVLGVYGRRFGYDEKVCVVRVPGRVNLMGRHIDHNGGHNSFLAIDRETLAVAGLRDDDRVVAVNSRPGVYPPVDFGISKMLGQFEWEDWLGFPASASARKILHGTDREWGNFVKASVLRLQHAYQDVRLRGLNLAFSVGVPAGAGLSSNSTVVVATLQSAIALHGFEVASHQFVDLWGAGQWLLPSGDADGGAPSAERQRGKVVHVAYRPFRVEQVVDMPEGYKVVIANSHLRTLRDEKAVETLKSRMATFGLSISLLRHRCPELAASVELVRDLDPTTLGVPVSDIYRILLRLPERATRRELVGLFPKRARTELEDVLSSHREPRYYGVRGVLLFGAAEALRSRVCIDLLARGDVDRFGRLMRVSHDGDRVAVAGRDGAYRRVAYSFGDESFYRLISDLESEDPDRVLRAQLCLQPGGYGCSTSQIDRMVDAACSVGGVVGAQMAGPGLGGCIMAVVRQDRVAALRRALSQAYYRPEGLKPDVLECSAVEGAGLVEF